jgi:hypothetical protein
MITRDWFGRIITLTQRNGTKQKLRVDNLSQYACRTADGETSHYINCVATDNPKMRITLHPDYLAKVFAGQDSSGKVEDMVVIDQTEVTTHKGSTKLKGNAMTEEVKVEAPVVEKAPAKVDKAPAKEKKPAAVKTSPKKEEKTSAATASKKERAETLYGKMRLNPNHTRQDIITAFKAQLDMTQAGATTYYYNLTKSQKPAASPKKKK